MAKPEIRELAELPTGKKLRGFEVDFELDKENWSDYHLLDGTKVRVKHTLVKIYRLVDENDEPLFDKNGDPEVYINGAIIVVASKPVVEEER
jgi:hypothetical protein